MIEAWKDVKGYKGFYQVSNMGRVKSLKRKRMKWYHNHMILKLNPFRKGYTFVLLCRPGKKQLRISTHKLVASHFLPNPNKFPIINHKNGIRNDNRIENLEWCTRSYNNHHSAVRRSKCPKCGHLIK